MSRTFTSTSRCSSRYLGSEVRAWVITSSWSGRGDHGRGKEGKHPFWLGEDSEAGRPEQERHTKPGDSRDGGGGVHIRWIRQTLRTSTVWQRNSGLEGQS